MKTLLAVLLPALLAPFAARAADSATVTSTLAPDAGRIVVEARGVPPAPPLVFTATVEQTVRAGLAEIAGELRVKLRLVQGRPDLFTLGLSGDGEITGVTGAALRDWAVRQAGGKRFLDLRLAAAEKFAAPADIDLVVGTRLKRAGGAGTAAVLIATPGEAAGFTARVTVKPEGTAEVRATTAAGLTPFGEGLQFFAAGEARLELRVAPRGAMLAEAELIDARLDGRVDEAARSVAFRLRAQVRAQKAGARLRLLAGAAAPVGAAAGDGWRLELAPLGEKQFAYDLVCEREGAVALDLAFAAAVRASDDWRAIDFTMPAGAVVPLQIEGLAEAVTFKADAPVVPRHGAEGWRGFLPADGAATLAWRHARETAEGALAFTSTEETEVRVASGVWRQVSRVGFRVLQGKLAAVRVRLDGPGEILGVEGPNVTGWSVAAESDGRVLDVRLSRPIEGEAALAIRAQAELGAWPVRAEPLRLTPLGGVRHSGFVRVAGRGAVRLEVADASGLTQLAPAQWPGAAIEAEARQVFVYRFPAAAYAYRVLATQVQPEVGVSVIATHELGESARVLDAAIELEVREAALRDWTLRVPADYTVVALTGAEVADHAIEGAADGAMRAVRVIFKRAVDGRQLIALRLEKNQPPAAGEWRLPALEFPGAKSVRGHLGAVAAAGYRLAPLRVEKLTEVPPAFFPRQTPGLQQAWRLRDADWTAELRVEALGRSVQADVFHLHTVREGAVQASVLLNFFVVGAPATEWRIAVPADAGNLDVTGQHVRRDWRREGDELIVSLHQPVLGAATLLVTYEQPLSARGGAFAPGGVRPLGVQAERGFVQVASPHQVKHEIRAATGALLRLEPGELPAEFRLLSSAPALATFHYTARPFTLEVGLERFAAGETVEQVVDFASLQSRVARDGQVVTEAKFFVKTRGQKALRLVLPAGAKLWEVRVNDEVVNARIDGERTLVPLPARPNPNDPVVVALRLGHAAAGNALTLTAPRVAEAPTMIGEWTVRGEEGRQLVPRGGAVPPLRPALAETGFEWLAAHGGVAPWLVFAAVALATVLLRGEGGGRRVAGFVICAVALGGAGLLAGAAYFSQRLNAAELVFATAVVPADGAFALAIDHLPAWRAGLVGWGLLAMAGGVALVLAGRDNAAWRVGGAALLAAGVLAQHGGAPVFFVATGAFVMLRLVLPAVLQWRRASREAPAAGAATVASLLVALTLLAGGAPKVQAQEAEAPKALHAVAQTWSIRGERLLAEAEVTVRGKLGESFLLLRAPAVLTDFKGDGLRVAKIGTTYHLAPERDGTLTARVRYELPLADLDGAIPVPTGPAAALRVSVELDQGGWEFFSEQAVRSEPLAGADATRSGATLVLAPHADAAIRLRPRRRDPGAEATVFHAEIASLFTPGPGVVNGLARVTVRPVQGRVAEIELEVPAGLAVGEVSGGPVGAWRFDPAARRLRIAIEPAQAEAFSFAVETQLGAGELPYDLAVEPLRAPGAAGAVGTVALAFGGEAQPEGVKAAGLAALNAQDFDASLVPRTREGQPAATVLHAWRHGAAGGRVELKVAPVAAEVRVASRQTLTLDDDRMVMAVDLRAAIARAGIFRLSFALPEGLEIEAVSGAALSHWTETQENSQRWVTLHLRGRTLGEQAFALSLAGAAPRPQAAWAWPRLLVREAARQTAEVVVVPGRGLRLRAAERERATPLDPRELGAAQPGALAFRLLQDDWVLRLGIEALEPWVTVQALQDTTVREGQTLTRLAVRYRVENSAVKTARLRLPGLGEDTARTVRATGPAVAEIARVADTPDTWEIRFQRGIAGETDVQIEFQAVAARADGREGVATPEFVGARQVSQFVAVRGGGRLELAAPEIGRGWTRTDWGAVPAALQSRGDRSVPALCFRVTEPEGPLGVTVRRHEIADALKLRVTQGDLLTLFSPAGAHVTSVELKIDVLEKSSLRVRLPAGARLFNAFVNGESVPVVREGAAWMFHVAADTATGRAAAVRLAYGALAPAGGRVALAGPGLSVPLENVTWRVVVPPGFALGGHSGGLQLRGERATAVLGLGDYTSLVGSKRAAEAKQAMSLLSQAGAWAAAGEQEKATAALANASNNFSLDAAANEDARVQLRKLKTEQTVLSLNTRRQRLYLDNRADAARNEPLERAAGLNPFMQGKLNFNPQQADQLLQGNSADENAALRGIAARLVEQQLAAEPPPGAIDVTLPQRGQVLTFTRALQVDGGAPLELTLAVRAAERSGGWAGALALLAVAAIAVLELRRREAV